MNVIGQLVLYISVGVSYLMLFVMTEVLIAQVLLRIYKTAYWYPVIFGLGLGLMLIFHDYVTKKYINFSLNVNVGRKLLKNVGKALILLILSLLFLAIYDMTGCSKF